jgi:predicted transglutaminase-like cysteine proteinase
VRVKSHVLAVTAWLCFLTGSVCGSEFVLPPLQHTLFCQRYPNECLATAQASLSLSEPATIRVLQKVNSDINRAISPIRLPRSPFNEWTIFPNRGICGDFAVTKRHVLQSRGWPSSRLLLAEVALRRTGERHLILVVKSDRGNWILDNLSETVSRMQDATQTYRFLRIESQDEPRYWKSLG